MLTVLLSVLVPPFNLGKLLADAAQITKPIQVLDEGSASVVLKASGTFGWSSLTQYRPNRTASVTYRAGEICDTVCKPICATVCTTQDPSDSWYIPPPPLQALAFLLLATALYAFLAWYFAQIFTGDAHSEQAGFFLSSAYWRGAARDSKEAVRAVKAALRDRLSSADEDDEVDSDVAAEARAVCELRTRWAPAGRELGGGVEPRVGGVPPGGGVCAPHGARLPARRRRHWGWGG